MGANSAKKDLKFLLVSDTIQSKNDNDVHLISVPRLAQLYGLSLSSPNVKGLIYTSPPPKPKYPLDATPEETRQIWTAYDNAFHVHMGMRQADMQRHENEGFILLFPRYDGDYKKHLEGITRSRRLPNN